MGGIDSGIGIAHRQIGIDGLMDGISDVLIQLVITRHVAGETPWIGQYPSPGVHGHIEVGIDHIGRHVIGVITGLRLAEGAITAGGLLLGPVVVIIAVQVDLIHIPTAIEVVAVSIE